MGVLSWMVAAGLLLVSYVAVLIRRLYFSPLSNFPGPRLAAMTNWYEFYYDILLQGKFTSHIQALHKKYGPIIRITPTEIHINDPEYFDVLHSRSGRRNKYAYFSARFGFASDIFSTVDHDLHRLRRRHVSPFFSAAKITGFQPIIQAKIEKLCHKLSQTKGDQVVNLDRAWMALTTDIITEYAFARSYNHLDSPDFRETLDESLKAIYTTGSFALHFPIIYPILDSLPEWFIRLTQPAAIPMVEFRRTLAANIREIRDGLNEGDKTVGYPTIFHELLRSDLPPQEKSNSRLADEALLVVGAGLITTARALTIASFHIGKNPTIGVKLREEFEAAGRPIDWTALEKLPYLNGCVRESIRLGHGVSTRDPRLAPDGELQYGYYTIPRNTPVSMSTVDVLMNGNIFPDPETFNPERWIGNPGLDRYFVAFGKGHRQCAGINLAQAELYLAMSSVFTRFELDLFETDITDVEMAHAYLVPYPKWDTKGVRAKVRGL